MILFGPSTRANRLFFRECKHVWSLHSLQKRVCAASLPVHTMRALRVGTRNLFFPSTSPRCVRVRVCVTVCVRERERERDIQKDRQTEAQQSNVKTLRENMLRNYREFSADVFVTNKMLRIATKIIRELLETLTRNVAFGTNTVIAIKKRVLWCF